MNYFDILKACNAAGISITELCERAGVPRMTVYRYRVRIPRAVSVYNRIKNEVEKINPTPRTHEQDND